jgi:iduronate 2-sulfatase
MKYLLVLPTILILLCTPSTASAAPKAQVDATPPRNILFIAVDDLRPELNCFGADHIHSPNIDRLASRGTVFLNAYCQQAVCSPSRTSLMTGLRPDSTKVWDLETHFRDHVPETITVAQHFKDNGYHSVSMGKIYHGNFDDELSWSEPALKSKGASRYALPENLKLMADKTKAGRAKGLTGKPLRHFAHGPATEMADVPDESYTDGANAQLAVKTMRQLAANDQPFFLAVGFSNPHLPFNSPKKYWDLYDPAQIQLAPNPFAPKNAPEPALTNSGEIRNYPDIPNTGPLPDDIARNLKHGYYAAVSFIDACVGKLLDELDQLDIADNTVVVLWGDHGWKLGEHGAWCKHTNFENDANAPLILAAPNQKDPGATTTAHVEFVDIYPTLCDLAGLEKPAHLEGSSFTPLLDDANLSWKRAAFSQYPRKGAMGYSMKTDDFRFTLWVNRDDHDEIVATELYDHRKDPAENENVANNPEYAPEIKKLTQWLREGWPATRTHLDES